MGAAFPILLLRGGAAAFSVAPTGTLVFHCNTCDTDWCATGDEIAMFRKEFRKESAGNAG